jgi:sulfur relay protein TusB/DsrH
MSNLYLIDQPAAASALALAAEDEAAIVVLVQDGVYSDISRLASAGRKVYAIDRDVQRRGLGSRLDEAVQRIGFDGLVDLVVEHKVVNFA